jgi:hypothetical protein
LNARFFTEGVGKGGIYIGPTGFHDARGQVCWLTLNSCTRFKIAHWRFMAVSIA